MSNPGFSGGGTVSPSDILTAIKNIVNALSNAAQTYLAVQGTTTSTAISAATLVKSGTGRLAVVSITTAGSAAGTIYDAASSSATSPAIYTIPTTVGVVMVNLPVSYGIVVAPGTGQVLTVSYS